ncbi:hypothetical protein D9757_014556 [Collybiopsis confluens]|uniref:Uncharacterized protein n=1 Tax=Collybiopsis confluens TaxID=2823264 RepID=A0A8H5FNS1_9AGAR|nr:hypothetical protein D9757_014556 [Collybiopsis confluens]
MALQTSSSSSSTTSIATSTSPSSTSSSSDGSTSDTNSNSSNFFGVTSSPPLILAFLAIGLLATAIVAALGWRRVYAARYRSSAAARQQQQQERAEAGGMGRHGRRRRRQQQHRNGNGNGIGERPKLWVLWTCLDVEKEGVSAEGTSSITEVAWESVMPIALNLMKEESCCSTRNCSSEIGGGDLNGSLQPTTTTTPTTLIPTPRPDSRISTFQQSLARLFRLSSRQETSNILPTSTNHAHDSDPNSNSNANDNDTIRDPEKTRPCSEEHLEKGNDEEEKRPEFVEVMVAIAMPTLRTSWIRRQSGVLGVGQALPGDVSSGWGEQRRIEPELYECSAIGVCRVPWAGTGEG